MPLTFTSNLDKLTAKLASQRDGIPKMGANWVMRSARATRYAYTSYIKGQARPGGAPPPLSGMTKHIYSIDGKPDGSGILNHLDIAFSNRNGIPTATFGIPKGKPTMIAKVQDQGATIQVTPKMRGFLAAKYQIFLKASTRVIVIPARQSWSATRDFAMTRALLDLRRELKGLD